MEHASYRVILPPSQTMFGTGHLLVDRQIRYSPARTVRIGFGFLIADMDEVGDTIFQVLHRKPDREWRRFYG